MTRNEQWIATFELLEEEDVVSDASCMEELTEYLHQVGLGGEDHTFMDVLRSFKARSPQITRAELVWYLERIYSDDNE